MARRGRRKGRGRRGRGALPIAQTAMLVYPVLDQYAAYGFSKDLPVGLVYGLTGFNIKTGKWQEPSRGIGMAVGLIALSTIGAKVANRVGANRLVKKATGGLLKLM